MKPDYEQNLAARIDATLKGLPELPAPDTLARRVMAAVARRAARPWYRQSWQTWPAPLRYATLVLLLGSFCGLCFASWRLTRAAGTQLAWQEVSQLFPGAIAVGNAFLAVLNGLVLALKHVNTAVLVGCAAAFGLAWALFVGLGTACVKLAMARRTTAFSVSAVREHGSGTGTLPVLRGC